MGSLAGWGEGCQGRNQQETRIEIWGRGWRAKVFEWTGKKAWVRAETVQKRKGVCGGEGWGR